MIRKFKSSKYILIEVKSKKTANNLVNVFFGSEWAYFAPIGADRAARGAINNKPKRLT